MPFSDDVLQLIADIRVKLYTAPEDVLKIVTGTCAPLFDTTGATRPKMLGVLEEYIANVLKEDKMEDTLKELLGKLSVTVKTEKTDKGVKEISVAETTKGVKDTPEKVLGTYSFRKEFKIIGQIGDVKTGLSFTSYRRQVEDGERKGYKETEIIEGVIRAIQPQNKLRSYLEGRPSLDLAEVNSIIRSFYKERTATYTNSSIPLPKNLKRLCKTSFSEPLTSGRGFCMHPRKRRLG